MSYGNISLKLVKFWRVSKNWKAHRVRVFLMAVGARRLFTHISDTGRATAMSSGSPVKPTTLRNQFPDDEEDASRIPHICPIFTPAFYTEECINLRQIILVRITHKHSLWKRLHGAGTNYTSTAGGAGDKYEVRRLACQARMKSGDTYKHLGVEQQYCGKWLPFQTTLQISITTTICPSPPTPQ